MTKDTANLNLSRETGLAFTAKLALAVVGFLAFVVFARVLGPVGIGVYGGILAATKLLVQVPSGIGTAIRKRVSEVDTDPSEYLGFSLVVHLGYVVVIFVGITLLDALPVEWTAVDQYAFGVLAMLTALGIFTMMNKTYSGIGYPGASFWADTVRSFLTAGFQLTFIWFGYRVFGLVAGFALATLLSALLVWFMTKVVPRMPSRETVVDTLRFARWSVPNLLLQNAYMRVDVLLIIYLVGSTAAGYYEAALRLTMPGTFIAASIGTSLTVKASGLSSLDESVVNDLKNAVSYAGLLSIPVLFGVLALPRPLAVTVYGSEFATATGALIGLAMFQVLNTYRIPFDQIVNGIDRPDLGFRVNLLTLLVHLPLAVALGYVHGLIGVVAATIVAETLRFALYQYVANRYFGEFILTRPIYEQFASGVIMFLGVKVISGYGIGPNRPINLAFIVATGAVIYFATLLAISPHFRLTLDNASPFRIPLFGQ
jgi:O-antigen/teichoic acid export membrane protein